MPRKNHRPQTRAALRAMAVRRAARDGATGEQPTPFELARDLVNRGLVSPAVLGQGRDGDTAGRSERAA